MAHYDLIGTNYGDDEIGGLDILGALEVLGAAASRKKRRAGRLEHRIERRESHGKSSPRLEHRMARLLGQPNPNVQVAQAYPEVLRDYEMPLGRITVEPGAPGTLRETAQRVIRIERLILSSPTLVNFDVTQIFMGVESQKAAIASSPAETYAFNAVASSLRGNTLQPGQNATVNVLNNGEEEDTIAGMFRGESLQY